MRTYRRSNSAPLKWLLAIILFVLAMTITFDDVHGINMPSGSGSSKFNPSEPANQDYGNEPVGDAYPPEDTAPVPEPTTLLLLAGGIGALAARRALQRRKAVK